QAPYLYYLYQSYGFLESQIAILYVTGFATNVVCSVVSVHLVQRYERRVLCLAFVGMNSISCLIKFSDSYTLLMAGRVMDGFAASLLTMPFHQWYVHEHVTTFDFPKEWIGSTFRRVAVLSGFLSVAAGFVAEFSESTFRITAFPFLIAIPVLIAGGFYMARGWSENRLDPDLRPPFWSQWSRALRTIGQRPIVFLLSAVQSLFESTIY
uniref:Molybdate-anion transporter n=1 Tax=Plectus sambesii TaxID=2011161 RepID=A0A914UYX6_9BILA